MIFKLFGLAHRIAIDFSVVYLPIQMKYSFNWAATASLTVLASLVMAIHDVSYRPAFFQTTTMALLVAKERSDPKKSSESSSKPS